MLAVSAMKTHNILSLWPSAMLIHRHVKPSIGYQKDTASLPTLFVGLVKHAGSVR